MIKIKRTGEKIHYYAEHEHVREGSKGDPQEDLDIFRR